MEPPDYELQTASQNKTFFFKFWVLGIVAQKLRQTLSQNKKGAEMQVSTKTFHSIPNTMGGGRKEGQKERLASEFRGHLTFLE